MKRLISILLILCLALSLTACGKGKDSGKEKDSATGQASAKTEQPDYTGGQIVGSDLTGKGGARLFWAQPVELPDEGATVRKAVKAGNEVFLYARTGDPLDTQGGEPCFYFLGANGTVTKVEHIQPGQIVTIGSGTDGSAYILFTDINGNPMLDRLQGGEIQSVAPMGFLADRLWDIWDLTVTDGGYLAETPSGILCYDLDGNLLKELGADRASCQLTQNPSELVLSIVKEGNTEFQVLGPDYEAAASYEVPMALYNLSAGSRDGHVFYSDAGILYDLDFTTGERTAYANEQASGGTGSFLYLADDLYFETADKQPALYTLAGEEAKEIQYLKLAIYDPEELTDLSDYIRQFNSFSREYRIEVVNYGADDEQGGEQTGLQRLTADILSGNTPDIYDLFSINAFSFMDKGLLEDLTPWFESSEAISLEDLTPSVVDVLKYKGALYGLVPAYRVDTLYGPSNLTDPGTWSFESFLDLANNTTQSLFGPWVTKADYLRLLLTRTGGAYLDLENARCDFVDSSFPAMLALADKVPAEMIDGWCDDYGWIFTGQQLLLLREGDLYDLEIAKAVYSGNLAVLGFPSQGSGIALDPELYLGMSSSSEKKEGVWSFFEYLLSDSFQNDPPIDSLPVKEAVLEAKLDKALAHNAEAIRTGEMKSVAGFADDHQIYHIPYLPVVPEEKDIVRDMIDRMDCIDVCDDALYDLVLREATPFFQGGISAQQAAENIQSKVSIYLAEQYG